MTTAGEVQFSRAYLRCVTCQQGGYPADERLGICGRYSVNVQRLAALAASSWSYDLSSERLAEFCGLALSDNTIRQIAQQQGAAMNTWLNTAPEACREFREADGEIEFTTDGTSVNTVGGWREVKLGMFSKREVGEAAPIESWASRDLPAPTTRVAFAAIEGSARFGKRWTPWRRRLGILDSSHVTVLADGAKWIWEEQLNHLRGAEGVLDIFHAVEHLASTARTLYGEGTERTAEWLEQGRQALLSDGWQGITQLISQTRREVRSVAKRASLDGLRNYLSHHVAHLHYRDRLRRGLSIGSGSIEGACKHLVGRRLKQSGGRWRVRRLNRMAGLCSVMYSHLWKTYWDTAAA